MLKLDYTYMMSDLVGPHGVEMAELEECREPVQKIHQDLQSARERGELPFYDLPFQDDLQPLLDLADDLAARFDNLVVLGIGGSALGTIAVARALLPLHHNALSAARRLSRPKLYVLDNVDPAGIGETLELLDPEQTCFCVVSKSGTTVETMSQFLIARSWVRKAVGETFREHFVLVTDPEKGVLRRLVVDEGYRSAEIPNGVGGRFSVFTAVGLLPLAVAGVDVRALLAGAAFAARQVMDGDLFANPAYLNAVMQHILYRKGAGISVMMPYSDRLADVSDWYRQLWAESLGKKHDLLGQVVHIGPTPVSALGSTDQHSQLQLYMEGPFDKVVTFIVSEAAPGLEIPPVDDIPEISYLGGKQLSDLLACEQRATAIALARAARPNCTIRLDDVSAGPVGALLYMLQVQTVFAGALFNVNPLDQPGVEAGKVLTSAFMGRTGFEGQVEEVERWESQAESKVLTVG